MTEPVVVDQSPPSLLAEGAPVEAPAAPPGDTPSPPPSKYTEAHVRKGITYLCNAMAAEWGEEMRATELELSFLSPPLLALLNAHAPDVLTGTDPDSSLKFVAVVILVMGVRRGLAIRRRRREAGERSASRPEKRGPDVPTSPAAAAAAEPNGAARRPVMIGGQLGDGLHF